MPHVQIMCLILKLAGNIGRKWEAREGEMDFRGSNSDLKTRFKCKKEH